MKDLEALLAKSKEELAGKYGAADAAKNGDLPNIFQDVHFKKGFESIAPLLIEMAEALEHYRKVDEFIWQDTSKAAVTLASVAKKLGRGE